MGKSYPSTRKKQQPFSQEEVDFVLQHNTLTRAEIAEKMQRELGSNRDVYAIKNLCRKFGINSKHNASAWNKGTTKFTKEQIAYIRQLRKTKGLIEVTNIFNKKFKTSYRASSIKSICQRFNINKEFEHFPIGYRPWNKGLKNNGSWGLLKNGAWKPPPNRMEIGEVVYCKKRQCLMVKTSLDKKGHSNFTPKHILVWRDHHGDIPEGKIVSFKDGVRTNCSISNLELIDRHEIGYRVHNSFYSAPPFLKETIRRLSSLQATIKRHENYKPLKKINSQTKVVNYLKNRSEPVTLNAVRLAVWGENTSPDVAYKALNRLVKKGMVIKVKRGVYALKTP